MGRLDEAEAKLKQATKQDPENKAAYYYLDLVNEAVFAQVMRERAEVSKKGLVEVAQAWNSPRRAPSRELPSATFWIASIPGPAASSFNRSSTGFGSRKPLSSRRPAA